MAERERVKSDKKDDADQSHRNKRQDSQHLSEKSLTWDNIPISPIETPFHPRMDEHAIILSRIPFSAQRHQFVVQLQKTYGNQYVQRLVESVQMQTAETQPAHGCDVFVQRHVCANCGSPNVPIAEQLCDDCAREEATGFAIPRHIPSLPPEPPEW